MNILDRKDSFLGPKFRYDLQLLENLKQYDVDDKLYDGLGLNELYDSHSTRKLYGQRRRAP